MGKDDEDRSIPNPQRQEQQSSLRERLAVQQQQHQPIRNLRAERQSAAQQDQFC